MLSDNDAVLTPKEINDLGRTLATTPWKIILRLRATFTDLEYRLNELRQDCEFIIEVATGIIESRDEEIKKLVKENLTLQTNSRLGFDEPKRIYQE
jgi:hypothetical protein